MKDWVELRRIRRGKGPEDDELGVLFWGKSKTRYQKTDQWIEIYTKLNGEIAQVVEW